MNRFKYISIFILGFIFTASLHAANFSSVTDGDWSTNATWGGASSPSISTSDNITINNSVSTSSDITIKTGGYLTIKAGGILTVHDIEFSNGSHIIIEEGGQLIVNGNLSNKNNSDDVEVNGSIDVSGNFDNGNGGVIFGTGSLHTDGDFTGSGTTFGQTNSSITSNSTVDGSSLPVEILYFESVSGSNEIILKWATASEINNDFFTIERSGDGVNFQELAFISGSGNTNNYVSYEYTDKEPQQGISYYRLKQTDYDGKSDYVGLLSYKPDNNDGIHVVFENPVRKNHFNITLYADGVYSVNLLSSDGKLLFSDQVTVSSMRNFSIPSGKLNSGFYLMSITDNKGSSSSHKIIIQ